jgi:hypothetical protein
MITTSRNENKTRVDYLVYKQVSEALDDLKKAATLIHDTGETESDRLDKAVCFTQDAIDQLDYFLKENA